MHLGWKWVFFIIIPLLIIGFVICLPFVAQFNEHTERVKIDWAGNFLLLLSLTSLIYALIHQQQIGFDAIAVVNFVVFVIAGGFFIHVENRLQNPTLNFAFFQKTDFMMAVLSNTMSGAVVAGGMFFSPLFLQQVLGFSPVTAGAILLAFAVGTIIISPFINKIVKKIHERKTLLISLACGLAASMCYLGFFWFNSLIIGLIAFCLTGICLGINNSLSTLSATQAVGVKNSGAAIGTIFSIWNLTAALVVTITSVLFHLFSHNLKFIAQPNKEYTLAFILIFIFAVFLFCIGVKKCD